MKKKLLYSECKTVLTVFALLLSVLSWGQNSNPKILSQASGNSSHELKTTEQNPLEMMKGKREDISKRDAFSKHYKNEDGSYTAIIGSTPIHYRKIGGAYEDIDTRITKNADPAFSYANTTNLFESYYGAKTSDGIKSKTAEGEIREFLNTKMYWEVNKQETGTIHSKDVSVTVKDDKAYYNNLYGNISAEFITEIGKRKLNYIIPDKQSLGKIPSNADYLVFSEDVVLNGWTHTVTERGILIKDQNGKQIYLYENPVSADVKSLDMGEDQNTIYETALNGNTLTIKIKVKAEWLLSNQRLFPVIVDPNVTVYPTATGNYNTGSIDANGNKSANNDIYLGMRPPLSGSGGNRFFRGWASFNLTSIPTNVNISYALFGFYAGLNTLYGPDGQYALIGLITTGIPNTVTGSTLYNMCGDFNNNPTNQWFSLSAGQPTGNMSIELIESQRNAIVNSIPSGILSLGFIPKGSFSTSYTEQVGIYGSNRAQSTSNGRPYFVITYETISTDRTLTVSGAYTGASYANGSYTIANNTSVTATSGTRPGYLVTGWTGTGSTPATGTGGTANFTITANSTINWQWEQTETPKNIIFHNYGGSEQLAFNNSRIDTATPVFRMSHGSYNATDYQVEINTEPDFTGINWMQTFTGTYAVNTQANFTFNNSFIPINNVTYYVRARVRGTANVWSTWTTETYSFTYQTPKNVPGWFQTTQAQFQTDALSGVNADGNNDIITGAGGNLVTNGDFSNGTTGWTVTKSYNAATAAVVNAGDSNCSTCTPAPYKYFKMGYPWATSGVLTSDRIVISQPIDLTNVNEIKFNIGRFRSFGGIGTATNSSMFFKIGGTLLDEAGTTLHTSALNANGSFYDGTITVDTSSYTGVQIIKFVIKTIGTWDSNTTAFYYVTNVKADMPPSGTITSTPIHYASVQDATGYDIIRWNQTLGGGTLNLKLQGSADGVIFTDIPGYTAISQTGDGEKTSDISAINPVIYPHLRLEGTLNEAGVKLHDWAVEFKKMEPDCASETKWTSTGWTNGVPDGTGAKKKIVFETDYNSSVNPSNNGALVGCSAEVKNTANVTLESYHSLTIDNEIKIAFGASFVLKSDASLLQINNEPDNDNEGVIKVERQITESSPARKEYNYLSSPVIGQNMKKLFGNNVSNTPFALVLDEPSNLFVNAKDSDYQVKAKGFAVKEPKPAYSGTLAEYSGEPVNGEFDIQITKSANNRGWNLVGNPYPSGLDLHSLYYSLENDDVINPEFRFWDNRVNNTYTQYGGNYNGYSYAIYNATTGANGTGNPAPGGDAGDNTNGTPGPATPIAGGFRFVKVGQGFLVRAKNLGTAELNFSNDFRTITQTTDDGFFGKSAQTQDDRYRLQLITPDEMVLTNTVVYFESGNNTFGTEDSKHPSPSASDAFYSFAEEEKVVINGRSSFTDTDIIRLGANHYTSGIYKIRVVDAAGIFPYSQRIYLKDKENNTITDLSGGEYVFSSESGSFTNRFEIVYQPEATLGIAGNTSNIVIYRDGEDFVIRSAKQIRAVELYDISGKLMLVLKKSGKEIRVNAGRMAEGIYILKVEREDGANTMKKIRK